MIAARWPGKVDSIGSCGTAATISVTGRSTRCGASGMKIVASASFASTAPNRKVKPPAEMTSRERDFSSAARRARSGAVTRTFSMRGTESARLAPRRDASLPNRPSCGGGCSAAETDRRDRSCVLRTQFVLDHCVELTGIGRGAGAIVPRAMPSRDPP